MNYIAASLSLWWYQETQTDHTMRSSWKLTRFKHMLLTRRHLSSGWSTANTQIAETACFTLSKFCTPNKTCIGRIRVHHTTDACDEMRASWAYSLFHSRYKIGIRRKVELPWLWPWMWAWHGKEKQNYVDVNININNNKNNICELVYYKIHLVLYIP